MNKFGTATTSELASGHTERRPFKRPSLCLSGEGIRQDRRPEREMKSCGQDPTKDPTFHAFSCSTSSGNGETSDNHAVVVLPPVGTWNPRVLGSSEPTPEESLRWGGAQGGFGSNTANWIPHSGVQGELVQNDTGQHLHSCRARHVRLERRVTTLPHVLL